jgi:hypothetical protein
VDDGEAMRRLLNAPNEVDAIGLGGAPRGETAGSLAQHAENLRLPLVMISG